MLIRVTTQCKMGCSHCLVDAQPNGAHIPLVTYLRSLDVSVGLGDPIVLLSGGEPTEHPRIVDLIREASRLFRWVGVLSNGLWLHHKDRAEELLATGANFQITNDPRFYPRRIPEVELETSQITYAYKIPTLTRLGRYQGPSNRMAPACFNLRSATHHFGSFVLAVQYLREQSHKFCTPSIDVDGTIRAGETPECYALGDIWSTEAKLTRATLAHDCDRCGLHERLPPDARKAIKHGHLPTR